MIGVSKTFGGSSILSSPALVNAEKLGKSSLSAFFVLRNLRKGPPKDHYILERIDYIRDAEQIEKMEEIANAEYADLEDNEGVAAVINAYFALLQDVEAGPFDGSATISRAQAMALLMRATIPVNEAQAPEINADFTSAVGESQNTDFAAPMNEYSYLNTENGLNEQSFNGTMTKGAFIALVTNYIRADYLVVSEKMRL